tara:strand:- start:1784 stop:1993 length:210 start_codon:yes stop_codon:yes gene_type:complete
MKQALNALEEIYIEELPYIEDIEEKYSIEIVEYLIDIKLAEFLVDEEKDNRIYITGKGKALLQQYEIIE